MNTLERQKVVYEALNKVYREGAYSGIQLSDSLSNVTGAEDKAYITATFYGVLEKDVTLSYYLAKLCEKKPKPAICVIIKMGLYALKFSSSPDYASIDNAVNLCKAVGKREVSGFVNAVLRRAKEVGLPDEKNKILHLSVLASVPEWLVKRMIKDYGYDRAKAILTAPLKTDIHIRRNLRNTTEAEFEQKLAAFEKSPLGYYVAVKDMKKLKSDTFSPMSLASAYATYYYKLGIKDGARVLDTCAAPGGKSVYLSELGNFDITACDVHEHRVELIKKYVQRMHSNVVARRNDATVYNPEWEQAFDAVICDVPCSGIGVISSKPDVLLNRKEEDIAALARLQSSILETSSKYVKKGGRIFYSTCTVLKEENDGVVKGFLSRNPNFEIEKLTSSVISSDNEGFVRLMPDTHSTDGFFVVCMKRKN